MRAPKPHDYGCECEECHNMAKAIGAQDENGDYVFSDEELYRIAMQNAQAEEQRRCEMD